MNRNQRESGVVLIMVLWVIIILAATAMSLLRQVQLEAKMVGFQRDSAVADSIAKAGIRQALLNLREDVIKDNGEDFEQAFMEFGEEDSFVYDGGSEKWADNPELYDDVPFYTKGRRNKDQKVGYYYVEVEDEASKFPINNQGVTLEMIAHLLELTGVEEEQAKQLAGAIFDWKDVDTVVTDAGGSTFGQDGSDEFSFYNSGQMKSNRSGRGGGGGGQRGRGQAADTPPIAIKSAELDSIDELLLIPGMTPDIVYGTVKPEDKQRGGGRFGKRRMRKGEYLGLKDYISVYADKINLNTVKHEVLEAVLFQFYNADAETMTDDWIEYINGRDGEPYTEDDNVIKTADNTDMDDMHFTEVNGWNDQVVGQLTPFADIKSNNFVITSAAEFEGVEKGYRAVVYRNYITWDRLPQFGFDTQRIEDLQQDQLQIRLFEPLFDVKRKIEDMS